MKTALNRTPASFPVRRMDYNFEDTPRYWCNHEPSLTTISRGFRLYFLKVNHTLLDLSVLYELKLKRMKF